MMKSASITLTLAMAIGLAACEQASSPSPLGEEGYAFAQASADGRGEGSVTEERQSASGLSQSAQEFPFQKILCFGDSITYGVTSRTADGWHSLAQVEGYVPKLDRLLKQEYGAGIRVINSGIGAENSSEGVERLDAEVRVYQPDLVLLLEGIIDIGNDNPPFNLVRNNLEKMMSSVTRRGSQVIIGTYFRLHPDGFRIKGIDNVPRLNDVIRDQARRQGVLVADHEMAARRDLSGIGPDGLHPNDKGYELMAETWLEVIKELAARLTT